MLQTAMTRDTAMTEFLRIYAQLDDLVREICEARLDDAPDAEAREALARQASEERRHVAIQRAYLQDRGTPYVDRIPPETRRTLVSYFLELDWPEFVSALQITVEGTGSLVVRQVWERADEATRRALAIPLEDEERHVRFGMEQVRKALAALSPGEQEALKARIKRRVRETLELARLLPSSLRQCFEAAGLDCGAMNARILRETAARWRALGIELEAAA